MNVHYLLKDNQLDLAECKLPGLTTAVFVIVVFLDNETETILLSENETHSNMICLALFIVNGHIFTLQRTNLFYFLVLTSHFLFPYFLNPAIVNLRGLSCH